MKLKAQAKESDYTFKDLGITFAPKEHRDTENFETLECGCIWWTCVHCIHGCYRDACMTCEDPFDTI